MINKNYRDAALKIYGEACEICGHKTALEVHHINYKEHQEIENRLRKIPFNESLILEAKNMGFDEWHKNQLSKDDNTKNLAVLCGNCHSLIHGMDVGLRLLKILKPRKEM